MYIVMHKLKFGEMMKKKEFVFSCSFGQK